MGGTHSILPKRRNPEYSEFWRFFLSLAVAIREVQKLATAKALHLGTKEEEDIRKAFGRLSVLLMPIPS